MGSARACGVCGQVHEMPDETAGYVAVCVRCGSALERRSWDSLHRTAALSLAALILYLPANYFPIMSMELRGRTTDNTVWQGVTRLYQGGDQVIAVIVFLASILIPLLKLCGLFMLVTTTRLKSGRGMKLRTWIYRVIDAVGRWAMLDVLVLAILVSLVKLQRLATVRPGPGLLAFTGVVVLTMLASASFDPQLIWKGKEVDDESAGG